LSKVIKARVMPAAGLPINFQKFERRSHSGRVQLPSPEDNLSPADKARAEAEIIIRTARAEAEEILAEARREGHRDGMAEAVASAQSLMQRLEDDIATAEIETRQFLESLEPELLKLCLETVEKVIRHEVRTGPEVVLRVIKSCLRRVKENGDVRVRVNPGEVAAVRAQRDELLRAAEGIGAISIVDDRRVSPGGCVIETANGDLDATVETQLERVEQTLTETFEDDHNKTSPGFGEVP